VPTTDATSPPEPGGECGDLGVDVDDQAVVRHVVLEQVGASCLFLESSTAIRSRWGSPSRGHGCTRARRELLFQLGDAAFETVTFACEIAIDSEPRERL